METNNIKMNNNWVDINDQTPPPNEYVLINTCEGVTVAKYDGRGKTWGYVSQPDEPLAYAFYNMQTELLPLDDSERCSYSIKERVTHWMLIPQRPDIEYKKPREWTPEEESEWYKRQMDGIVKKYSAENNAVFTEMLNKLNIEIPPPIN